VLSFQSCPDFERGLRTEFGRAFDLCVTLFEFEPKETFVMLQDVDEMPRPFRDQRLHEGPDLAAVKLPVGKTGAQHPFRKLADLFVNFHQATWRAASS